MPATDIVETTLILIGVFAFALSGALQSSRSRSPVPYRRSARGSTSSAWRYWRP